MMIGMKRAGEWVEAIHDRRTKRKVRAPFLQLFPGKRQQILQHALRRQRGSFRHYLWLQSSRLQSSQLTLATPASGGSEARKPIRRRRARVVTTIFASGDGATRERFSDARIGGTFALRGSFSCFAICPSTLSDRRCCNPPRVPRCATSCRRCTKRARRLVCAEIPSPCLLLQHAIYRRQLPGLARRFCLLLISCCSRARKSPKVATCRLGTLVHMKVELEEKICTKHIGKPPSITNWRHNPIELLPNTTKKGTTRQQPGIRSERWSIRIALTGWHRKPTTNPGG